MHTWPTFAPSAAYKNMHATADHILSAAYMLAFKTNVNNVMEKVSGKQPVSSPDNWSIKVNETSENNRYINSLKNDMM